MSRLDPIVSTANRLLRVSEIKDYPNAVNGLQLQNSGTVTRLAAAVDACEPVVAEAVRAGGDLLVVHHGMFWDGLRPATGALYRKLKLAMDANLAIYSCHLPLDAHPVMGNNALLARAIGFSKLEPFLEIGFRCRTRIARKELLDRVTAAVGSPVRLAPGGPGVCRSVGIVTGGSGGEIAAAAAAGVDTFIVGEGPHWSYTAAEELGVNLIYAGHYATETFGVKALAGYLAKKFRLPWQFIDHPTGL